MVRGMESAIFTNMSKLRKVSIISTIISLAILFSLTTYMEADSVITEESKAIDQIEKHNTMLSISIVFLFTGPAAGAGIVASFVKKVKLQIIIWVVITLIIWAIILAIALLMLIDPISFGIPENYWELPPE